MAQPNLGEIATKVVGLLTGIEKEDRRKVIDAAMILLGEGAYQNNSDGAAPNVGNRSSSQNASTGGTGLEADKQTAKQYFDLKTPKSKMEALVVAARFREENEEAAEHEKDDFVKVFKDARRNFDAHNYFNDIRNARKQGYFNKTSERGTAVLSHYGQNYADTLPDRDALKKLAKPSSKRKSKNNGKAK